MRATAYSVNRRSQVDSFLHARKNLKMSDQPSPPPPPPENSKPEGNASAAVAEPNTRLDRLPPFKVILHNDDTVLMDHVVRTLVMLTPLTQDRAIEVMIEAHSTGAAFVLSTHRERAELYADQFKSRGLTASIEPA
jgi:ATP-dependent Clp protease adapter protein ClpS